MRRVGGVLDRAQPEENDLAAYEQRHRIASTRRGASGPRTAAATRRFSRPVRYGWKRGSSTIAPTMDSALDRAAGMGIPSRRIVPDVAEGSPSNHQARDRTGLSSSGVPAPPCPSRG